MRETIVPPRETGRAHHVNCDRRGADGPLDAARGGAPFALDRRADAPVLPVTRPSLGPGASLDGRVRAPGIGVGRLSLLGEFPFDQGPGRVVSIPREGRLVGRRVDADFGPIAVTTHGAVP